MTHLTFEEISELAESPEPRAESPEPTAQSRARHLSECARCRETLVRVRELVAAASALPRGIAPPAEVWIELSARVAREPKRRHARWWHNGRLASAAAIVLVVGTALLMPRGPGKAKAKAHPPAPVAVHQTPNVVLTVDRTYAATVDQLREALDAQRATLSPSTVQTVERSLALIDRAIEELRAALASDPANQALLEILSAHYERKVDLLQRATKLSPSL